MNAWDRIKVDTDKSFRAFTFYRDMGPERSLAKVREKLGKDPGYGRQLEVWSSKHRWVARAGAYDGYLDRERQKKAAEEIDKMHLRHASYAENYQRVLMLPVQAMAKKLQEEAKNGSPLHETLSLASPKVLLEMVCRTAYLMPGMVKLERLSRGEPEDVVAQSVGIIAGLAHEQKPITTDDELKESILDALAVQYGRAGGNPDPEVGELQEDGGPESLPPAQTDKPTKGILTT